MKLDGILALTIAAATLFIFGLSMRWFRNRKDRTPAKTGLTITAYVCAAIQLTVIGLSHPVPAACRWLGVGLYVLALVVFWWSRRAHGSQRPAFAFAHVMPTFLTQTGPYRLIRHPIYSAYLLAWLAGPVIAAQPWLLLTTLWTVVFYIIAARREERFFAATPMAQDYAEYRRRTGMFLPSVSGIVGLFSARGTNPR